VFTAEEEKTEILNFTQVTPAECSGCVIIRGICPFILLRAWGVSVLDEVYKGECFGFGWNVPGQWKGKAAGTEARIVTSRLT
jgi:hypothetical protein